ncbi:MAG: HAMP domain-containing histidine kinase [Candidatus Aminicenantes bacterium]|nr:HAMP domain-containing histidine kinase [Candidatus Aminicenantes bacterium]
MRSFKFSSHLRLFFVIVVVIPCTLLTIIAIRSINREKAYIEKRFQEMMLAEITHTASLLEQELTNIQAELNSTSPSLIPDDPNVLFTEWKIGTPLVEVPFLLSSSYEILWPRLSGSLSDEELFFINWNKDFITNQASIPVYQNIALLYKDQIMDAFQRDRLPVIDSEEIAADENISSADKPKEKFMIAQDSGLPASAPNREEMRSGQKTSEEKKPETKSSHKTEELEVGQRALQQFEKNEGIRQEVYRQAQEKGQTTSTRNVMPSMNEGADTNQQKPEPEKQESIFISEPQRFYEITQGKEMGLIPRFIEEQLTLLFWKKEQDLRIVGCMLDSDQFKSRMMSRLPDVYSSVRILTILDENGRPLLSPEESESRDWRRPFIAQEISELLPRWEVAAYLTDPGAITSKANTTAVIMWILILIFFVSIVTGGTYVLNTLRSEMDLARKKTNFVANVSHELKTPLTSIRMFAEMLRERRQTDRDKQEKYLDIMVSETERLTRLINNVLDFSRMDKGKKLYEKKILDAASLCEELLESQRLRLEQNGFEINFTRTSRPVYMEGDEEAFKQAVLNLLSNAEKYSQDQKKIDVEVTSTDDSVLINVKDRGIGIEPKQAQKIFKEFYRADESLTSKVRGSGLGLTISKKIINDLRGDILYYPREGGGSVFQIKLPVKDLS